MRWDRTGAWVAGMATASIAICCGGGTTVDGTVAGSDASTPSPAAGASSLEGGNGGVGANGATAGSSAAATGSPSGTAGGVGTGGTAGTAGSATGGSPPICAAGDVLTSACIDGSLVPRCVCLAGDWDCLAAPERACPGYCSDGSELDTTLPVPDCEGAVLGIQNGAWRCARADSCRDSNAPGCMSDLDCDPGAYCEPCAHGSCPVCLDCVAECLPLRCASEADISCDSPRPGCGYQSVPIVQDGCWTCVDYSTCEPSACVDWFGTCSAEPCGSGDEVAPGATGCDAGEHCCVGAEVSIDSDPPEMSWLEPTATESDQTLDELARAYVRLAWVRCDAEARCCSALGDAFDPTACRVEQAAETRRLAQSVFPLGRVSLDSALLEACLLGLAQAGCDDAMPSECDAAFVGSVADDGSCVDDRECAVSPGAIRYCGLSDGACFVAHPAALGEPCEGNCQVFANRWSCSGSSSYCYAHDGMRCVDGECAPLPGDGEACYADSTDLYGCQAGRACVDNVCQTRIPLGESCTADDPSAVPCIAGAHCSGGSCVPVGLAGDPCDVGEQCASGSCGPDGCLPRLTRCGSGV